MCGAPVVGKPLLSVFAWCVSHIDAVKVLWSVLKTVGRKESYVATKRKGTDSALQPSRHRNVYATRGRVVCVTIFLL